jgi:hypothetical protein
MINLAERSLVKMLKQEWSKFTPDNTGKGEENFYKIWMKEDLLDKQL